MQDKRKQAIFAASNIEFLAILGGYGTEKMSPAPATVEMQCPEQGDATIRKKENQKGGLRDLEAIR